jgi:hypothetical protein
MQWVVWILVQQHSTYIYTATGHLRIQKTKYFMEETVKYIEKPCRYTVPLVQVISQPTVSRPVCPGIRPPSGTCDHLFFLLPPMKIIFRQLLVSYYGASSLMRGWACNLKLLLSLTRTVFLRSKSHITHDHISLSQFWDHLNLVGRT